MAPEKEHSKQIEEARRLLHNLISSRQCADVILHLAGAEAGTYDGRAQTGGSYDLDLDSLLDEVEARCPRIPRTDLYQLAQGVALEITSSVPRGKHSKESREEGHPRLAEATPKKTKAKTEEEPKAKAKAVAKDKAPTEIREASSKGEFTDPIVDQKDSSWRGARARGVSVGVQTEIETDTIVTNPDDSLMLQVIENGQALKDEMHVLRTEFKTFPLSMDRQHGAEKEAGKDALTSALDELSKKVDNILNQLSSSHPVGVPFDL